MAFVVEVIELAGKESGLVARPVVALFEMVATVHSMAMIEFVAAEEAIPVAVRQKLVQENLAAWVVVLHYYPFVAPQKLARSLQMYT